jgi:hypothetical protein
MATPVVTLTPDRASYSPGDPIVVAVSAVDADNSSERLVLSGTDSQGNAVTVALNIDRRDTFTITSAVWERTGVALAIDQAGMRVSGSVPSA